MINKVDTASGDEVFKVRENLQGSNPRAIIIEAASPLYVAMRFNPEEKMAKNGRMEKWPVRKAFEDILPESVAWRQKEQFSDGVGYGWIDTLKKIASEQVTDEMMENAKYPVSR